MCGDINVKLFYLFNHNFQNPFFDMIMPIITHFGGFRWLIIILFAIIIYARFKNNSVLKKIAILALFAFLFSDIIVFILKILIQKPRPFVNLSDVHLLISESDPNSFPSGHTTSTISVVTIFVLNMKKLIKKYYHFFNFFLIIFAVVIPFSRMYVGVHYPFDVFAGAVIGIFGALFVSKLNEILSIIKF